jgi:hypothetical protein
MIGKPALAIFSSPGNCHEYINDEGPAIDKYCKYPRPANRFSVVWKQLIEKHRIFLSIFLKGVKFVSKSPNLCRSGPLGPDAGG